MTDQPKPEKPSATPAATEPKSAEKEVSPSAGSQSGKPDAASLPVTEKMPPPPPAGDSGAKPAIPPIQRVDTKPVTPEKTSPPAPDSSPAVPAVPSPDAKASPIEPAAAPAPAASPEVKPVTSQPLPPPASSSPGTTASSAKTEPAAAPAPTEHQSTTAEPPLKPAILAEAKATTLPAAEKPTAAPDATKPAEINKPVAEVPQTAKDDTLPPGSSQRVTQRFNEPSTAAPVANGTICPSCGHRNRPGTLICDNCGTNLVAGVRVAIGTRDLESAQETAKQDQPLLSDTQAAAVKSAGSTQFNEDMVLRIEIEGGATPMLVYPKQEIILGRRDPNTGTLPDVDLTAYAGYRMGVSRTHASIRLQDKVLNLSDRGSSNGTFLNGNRLTAHHPYPLRDGDEIRLGQMMLKIYFQSNKGRK